MWPEESRRNGSWNMLRGLNVAIVSMTPNAKSISGFYLCTRNCGSTRITGRERIRLYLSARLASLLHHSCLYHFSLWQHAVICKKYCGLLFSSCNMLTKALQGNIILIYKAHNSSSTQYNLFFVLIDVTIGLYINRF